MCELVWGEPGRFLKKAGSEKTPPVLMVTNTETNTSPCGCSCIIRISYQSSVITISKDHRRILLIISADLSKLERDRVEPRVELRDLGLQLHVLRVELLLLLLLVLGDEPAPLDLAFSRVVLLLIGRSVQPMIAAVDERAVRAAELRRHAAAGEARECCPPLDAHESSAHALRTFSTTCRGESAVRGAERARQHAGGVRAAHGRLLTSPAPTGVHSMAGFLRTRNSKT